VAVLNLKVKRRSIKERPRSAGVLRNGGAGGASAGAKAKARSYSTQYLGFGLTVPPSGYSAGMMSGLAVGCSGPERSRV
jgi:hypothetical protein